MLFTIGTIVQSFATTFPIAIVGRVLYGLGIGAAMHVAPLFIAETSPNDLRGRLVSFKEAAIVLGNHFYSFPSNMRDLYQPNAQASWLAMLLGHSSERPTTGRESSKARCPSSC